MKGKFSKAGTFRLAGGSLVYVHTINDKKAYVQALPEQPPDARHVYPVDLSVEKGTIVEVPTSFGCVKVDLSTLSAANRDWLAHQPEDGDPVDPIGDNAPGKPGRKPAATNRAYEAVDGAVTPGSRKVSTHTAVFTVISALKRASAEEVFAKLPGTPGWTGKQDLYAVEWHLRKLRDEGAVKEVA